MKNIQQSFARGETATALQHLHAYVEANAPGWKEPVLLLQAAFAHLEKQQISQLISNKEANLERNRIQAGGLELLKKIRSGQSNPDETLRQFKTQFGDLNVEKLLQTDASRHTTISGSTINVQNSRGVLVGSGNTLNQKIVNALGKWQFWAILVALAALGYFGFSGMSSLSGGQDVVIASLGSLRQELLDLVKDNPDLEEALPELEAHAQAGMAALKREEYGQAITELEQVAQKAPLTGVYRNLAYAYEQNGEIEEAYQVKMMALQNDPEAFAPRPVSAIQGKEVNLFAPENGLELIEANTLEVAKLMDNDLRYFDLPPHSYGVFQFVENRSASIHSVEYYIPEADNYNFTSFALLAGNLGPDGPFDTIGVYKPKNAYLNKTPFQPFTFPTRVAKYVKIIIGPGLGRNVMDGYAYEMRLWGTIK